MALDLVGYGTLLSGAGQAASLLGNRSNGNDRFQRAVTRWQIADNARRQDYAQQVDQQRFMQNFAESQRQYALARKDNLDTFWAGIRHNQGQFDRSLAETRRQYDLSRDFARGQYFTNQRREDTEIRRRVADARAAGLHPLFALGAAGNHAGALSISGTGAPGSSLPGAVSASPTGGASGSGFIPGQSPVGSFAVGSDGAFSNAARLLGAASAIGDTLYKIGAQRDAQRKAALEELLLIQQYNNNRQANSPMPEIQIANDAARTGASRGNAQTPGVSRESQDPASFRMFGMDWPIDPNRSKAQDIEDTLGGAVAELAGLDHTRWSGGELVKAWLRDRFFPSQQRKSSAGGGSGGSW